jgi:hypothetical protein
MTDHQANREMERMDDILRKAHRRLHKGAAQSLSGEPVDWDDPFEELARREEEALRTAAIDAVAVAQMVFDVVELPAPLVERVHALVFDEFRQYEEGLIEWLFAAGPHPLEVMRRLFAYVKMKRASLLWNMGFREIGPLLQESHGAAQWRCKRLFGKTPAGWKKSDSSVERMRKAQRGNKNRLGSSQLLAEKLAKEWEDPCPSPNDDNKK